ncbi:MAG: hypothetical protein ACI9QQ_000561 [Myxococcota bacterium]|jgi:hypothetical protein
MPLDTTLHPRQPLLATLLEDFWVLSTSMHGTRQIVGHIWSVGVLLGSTWGEGLPGLSGGDAREDVFLHLGDGAHDIVEIAARGDV